MTCSVKWIGLSGLLTCLFWAMTGLAETKGDMFLLRGHAEIRAYATAPATIVLGDEEVVTVNITPSDVLVLTARARGTTNVIVLDASGDELDRFLLSVFEPGEDITVRRGTSRQIVRCDPSCRSLSDANLSPVISSASHQSAE